MYIIALIYTDSLNPHGTQITNGSYPYFIEEAQDKVVCPKLHITVQSHAFNSVCLENPDVTAMLYCCNLPKEKVA